MSIDLRPERGVSRRQEAIWPLLTPVLTAPMPSSEARPHGRPVAKGPLESSPSRRAMRAAPNIVRLRARNGLLVQERAILGRDSDEGRCNLHTEWGSYRWNVEAARQMMACPQNAAEEATLPRSGNISGRIRPDLCRIDQIIARCLSRRGWMFRPEGQVGLKYKLAGY